MWGRGECLGVRCECLGGGGGGGVKVTRLYNT